MPPLLHHFQDFYIISVNDERKMLLNPKNNYLCRMY